MKISPLWKGILLSLFALGCSSTNLHQRPEWAKSSTIPKGQEKKYPPEKFIVQVVTGVGGTLSDSEKAAQQEANKVFARMISTKVTSLYQSRTQEVSDQYRTNLKKNIDSYINLMAKDILLAGLQKITNWDGYEKDKIYYFACYVLDKEVAGKTIEQSAQNKFKALQESQKQMNSASNIKEKELAALQALQHIMEFELLMQQALFFSLKIPIFQNGQTLKQECLKIVYRAIEDRMRASASQKDMEEALEFAQKTLEYYPSGVVQGKITALQQSLPCTECGRKGYCIKCNGQRGFLFYCGKCKGNKKVWVKCSTCNGDGRQACPQCNDTGIQYAPCNFCGQTGRVKCPTCRGTGKVMAQCNVCNGTRAVECQACAGNGSVQDVNGAKISCKACNGGGRVGCKTCKETGQRGYTCEASLARILPDKFKGQGKLRHLFCDGTGQSVCPQCDGRGKRSVRCSGCGGSGRVGVCSACNGRKQLYVDCDVCPPEHKGKIKKICEHCKGTGKCPVCKGKGHR